MDLGSRTVGVIACVADAAGKSKGVGAPEIRGDDSATNGCEACFEVVGLWRRVADGV